MPLTPQPSFRLRLPGSSMCDCPLKSEPRGSEPTPGDCGETSGRDGPVRGATPPQATQCCEQDRGATQLSAGPPPPSPSLGSVRNASDLFLIASLGLSSVFKSEDLDQFYCELNWFLGVEEYGHNRSLKDPVTSRLYDNFELP